MNMPQHPGRVQAQQGGLAPQEAPQQGGNPYYKPSAAMQGYEAKMQMAQAEQANAMANKAMAEKALIDQSMMAQGLGSPVQAGPTVQPQQVQAEQIADGLIRGQVGQEQLGAMIQAGELDPNVAQAAMGMAQQFLQEDQARNEQAMGLGAF